MHEIGVGIVGCGGAAVNVCAALDAIEGARLAATHDRNRDNAASLALPRGALVHETLEGLVSDPAVAVVYVATPHAVLAQIGLAALGAGKHALIEKPMGVSLPQIEALDAAARAGNLRLGVYFELRETASVQVARTLVRAGAIGEVRSVRLQTVIDKPQSYWQWGPSNRTVDHWRSSVAQAGGGVVLMNSIHQLDCVRYISGLEVVAVTGAVATLMSSVEVEDTASATLRFSNGALGSLAANAHSHGARRQERIEFDGTAGRLDLPDPYGAGPLRLYLARPWQEHEAGRWIEIARPVRDAHLAAVGGFIAAVRGGLAAPIGAQDAAAALAAVLAIYDSSRSGRSISL